MMKNLKSKLFATVAMLLVAIVMMSSASYAWFTISTNPEIKDLTATVVVNENLEIAYRNSATAPGAPAAGDSFKKTTTYGNLVGTKDFDAADKFVVDYAALDKTLRPAHLASGSFTTAKYGTDGRVDTVDKAITEKLTTGTGVGNLVDAEGKIYGYFIKLWVKTNVAGNLLICNPATAAKRSTAGTVAGEGTFFEANGTTLADKDLAANIGIAYKLGTGTITALAFDTVAEGATKKSFTDGTSLGALTANTDTELTIYVYLEGATVKNASASIASDTIDGKLNIQFKNSAITTGSMDAQS